MPAFRQAEHAPVRGEVILIPPRPFKHGRQWPLLGRQVGDQVARHRDQGLDSLRPQGRDDVTRPRSPVIAGQDRLLDPEGIHQSQDVQGERHLIDVPGRRGGQEGRCAMAAEIRDDHPVALRRQQRRDVGIAVNVVGEAMHENDRAAVGGPRLDVSDIEDTGIDLPHWAERRAGIPGHCCSPAGLCFGGAHRAELGSADSQGGCARSAQQPAAVMVDSGAVARIHWVNLLWSMAKAGLAPEPWAWAMSSIRARPAPERWH